MRAEYDDTATSATRSDYDPFGTPETGTGLTTPAGYGFTGESRDNATGQVQLRARWYAPDSARFTSRDPWLGDAQVPQTLNPYAYAHNDPVNLTALWA